MKENFLVLFVVLLILSGCKSEVVPPLVTSQDGQIILKIDRENAPQNVTYVTAYLTRSGYSPITGSLNLLTDSTAEINLSNIPVGLWHLKVDAADSAGIVQYSGETDVTIIENQTVQVNLTLVPVTNGVGNIYLYVTWGTAGTWFDYPGNPVISGINNGYEYSGVFEGKVLFEDNKYKMWFTGLNPGGIGYIEYSESLNGTTWTRPINHPVLFPGPSGSWDQYSVISGAVLKDGNQYKLYYSGRDSKYGAWHIGLAVSQDGINFIKHPQPVVFAGTGWEQKISPSDIVKVNDTYYLYYDGMIFDPPGTSMYYKMAVATSSDGINFIKSSQNPILLPTQSWEGSLIRSGSVIYENGLFTMVYMNDDNESQFFMWGFGKATSTDGINWTKDSDNPFFTKQNTANHWTNWVGAPFFRKFNGQSWIYYSGYSHSQVYYKMGLLKSN